MGGGLLQLVAYGSQDVYLTGNPQVTFWKVVYRRHTNFAMESIRQNFNGQVNFGSRVTATISRNGDLIHKVYLQVDLPALSNDRDWVNSVGHALIKTVEVEIGGQRIDKHYGEWMEVWDELTTPSEKRDGYNQMVGKYNTDLSLEGKGAAPQTLYIPLQFWFCTNPGLSLPLIALQYHEVKVTFEFRELSKLVWTKPVASSATGGDGFAPTSGLGAVATASDLSATLWVDYIYLDTDERRRFAQVSHEYLITQLQFTGEEGFDSSNNRIRLNLNHPVKELVWVFNENSTLTTTNDMFNFASRKQTDVIKTGILQLNGHDRFYAREAAYFRLVQPYQHHTCVPKKPVYVYSFGLKPEDIQPSGTCNFSRIDNATLQFTMSDDTDVAGDKYKIKVFAVNYNVLRIMSGMGGMAYSN
tara:strand:- start:424 stop:1665 length:1242 start_codon:yes stop_codon:yes gene_type:complete